MKRKVLPAIRVLCSGVALGALFHFYDVSTVVHRALSMPSRSMLSAVLLFAASNLVSVIKWQLSLPRGVGLSAVGQGYLASFFYSLMPAGQAAGEVGKVMALAGRVSVHALAASVIFDKLTGLLALVLLGLFASIAAKGSVTNLMLVLLSGVASVGAASLAFAGPVDSFLARCAPKDAKLTQLCRSLRGVAQSLSQLVRLRHLVAKSLILGILAQGLMLAIYVVLSTPLDIQIDTPDLALIVVIANLAAVIPISVGGIGVREASLVGLLALYAVPGESAIALSLTVFAIFLLGAAAGGLIELKALIGVPLGRRTKQLDGADSGVRSEPKADK